MIYIIYRYQFNNGCYQNCPDGTNCDNNDYICHIKENVEENNIEDTEEKTEENSIENIEEKIEENSEEKIEEKSEEETEVNSEEKSEEKTEFIIESNNYVDKQEEYLENTKNKLTNGYNRTNVDKGIDESKK